MGTFVDNLKRGQDYQMQYRTSDPSFFHHRDTLACFLRILHTISCSTLCTAAICSSEKNGVVIFTISESNRVVTIP